MAPTVDEETERLCTILLGLKKTLIHRALVAWERSPETFGEEIVALNGTDETLRFNCRDGRASSP